MLNNENFNRVEFDAVKNELGLWESINTRNLKGSMSTPILLSPEEIKTTR